MNVEDGTVRVSPYYVLVLGLVLMILFLALHAGWDRLLPHNILLVLDVLLRSLILILCILGWLSVTVYTNKM